MTALAAPGATTPYPGAACDLPSHFYSYSFALNPFWSKTYGWVEGLTERTPLGRLGEADDIAEAIVALLEMSWVTGQIVFADGGLALQSPIDAYGQVQRLIKHRAVTDDR